MSIWGWKVKFHTTSERNVHVWAWSAGAVAAVVVVLGDYVARLLACREGRGSLLRSVVS